MNKTQEQEIIKKAFYEELEKDAILAELAEYLLKTAPKVGKFLPRIGKKLEGAGKYFGSKAKISGAVKEVDKPFFSLNNLKNYRKGAKEAFGKSSKEGFEYLKSHAKTEITKTNGGKFKFTKGKPSVGEVGNTAGAIQRAIGGTARELEFLGKKMSLGNPLTKNVGQFGKNFTEDASRQWNAAIHRVVNKETVGKNLNQKFEEITKGKDKYLRSKKAKIFKDRKIVGYDSHNNPITRKRNLAKLFAASVTPIGIAGTSMLTGNKKEGVKDYFKWKTPYGMSEMMYDMVKPGQ